MSQITYCTLPQQNVEGITEDLWYVFICGKNHIEWLMYICITAHSLPEMTEFLLLHEGANYILTTIQLGFIGDFLWSGESYRTV